METLDTPLPEIVDPAAAEAPKPDKIDITNELALVVRHAGEQDKLAAGLAELERQHPKTVALDLWKPDDATRADEGRKAYKRARIAAEKARQEFKAPLLALGRAIDAFAGKLAERLQGGEDHFRALQDKHEVAKRERRDGFHAKMARIAAMPTNAMRDNLPAAQIAKGIEYLESATIGPEWQEFQAQAEQVRKDTLAKLREVHANVLARELTIESVAYAAAQAEEQRKQAVLAGQVDQATGEIADAAPQAAEDQGGQAPEAARQGDAGAEVSAAPAAPSPAPTIDAPAQAPVTQAAPAPDGEPTLKLGDVCERLGFTMNKEFVEQTLRVPSAPGKGRAVLFHERQWPDIKRALKSHIESLV